MPENLYDVDMEVIKGVVAQNLKGVKQKAVEISRPVRVAESVPNHLDMEKYREIQRLYGGWRNCVKFLNVMAIDSKNLPTFASERNSLVISKDLLRQSLDKEDGSILGMVKCELDGNQVVSSEMTLTDFNRYLPRYLQEFGDKLKVNFKSNNIVVNSQKEGLVYLNYERNPELKSGPEEKWLYVPVREAKS